MTTLLLITNDDHLRKGIESSLPANWTVKVYARIDQAINTFEKKLENLNEQIPFLIDIQNQPDWADHLLSLQRDKVMVFAIVSDDDEQVSVCNAGVEDCLRKSLFQSELTSHLVRRIEQENAIHNLLAYYVQKDGQASVGKLTSHICHQINNAMQATRGALSLAVEEIENSKELGSYLSICQQETDRVINLLEWLRQTYRPQNNGQGLIQVDILIKKLLSVISKELDNNKVFLSGEIVPEVRPVNGIFSQIYLALLSIFMNLGEAIGFLGGGKLNYRLYTHDGSTYIEITTDMKLIPEDGNLQKGFFRIAPNLNEFLFSIHPAMEFIQGNNGNLIVSLNSSGTVIQISIPAVAG